MGQKRARWNLALNAAPAVGLLVAMSAPAARRHPATFLALASCLCAIGLGSVVVAKITVVRRGNFTTFGSRRMTARARTAYRLGYLSLACGAIGLVSFSLVWRQF